MQKSACVLPNTLTTDDSPVSCDKTNNAFGLVDL